MSAIALHPEMKLDYFDGEWEDKPEWISNAHNSSRRLWETEYKHGYMRKKSSTPNIDEDDVPAAAAPTIIHDREVDEFPIWKRKKRARLAGSNQDEFERFQQRDCDEDLTLGPLQYWVQRRNDPRQKERARMGIEIHSIPAMSADPERLFSRYYLYPLHQSSLTITGLICSYQTAEIDWEMISLRRQSA
jgi:hypothetical protein